MSAGRKILSRVLSAQVHKTLLKIMNKNLFSAVLLLALGWALSSCDIIQGEKTEPNPPISGSQKILLEEFTGHQCGGCPNAHRMIETLLESYSDNLIPVAIHSGHFSETDADFPADYTTPLGDEIHDQFPEAIQNRYPIGFLNRQSFNGSPALEYSTWSGRLFEIINQDAPLVMDIKPQYEASSRELAIEVESQYFSEGDADHRLVVLITEDSLVSPQVDYALANLPNPPADLTEPNYVHMHLLRGPVTDGGQYGIPVKGNDIFVGEKLSHRFDYRLPTEWRATHCHVVAYVLKGSDLTVLQAEQTSLIP